MIQFDIDSRYIGKQVVGSAISRRDGVALSLVVHALLLLVAIYIPKLSIFQISPEERQRIEEARLQAQPQEETNRTFVFVQPRVDLRALQPLENAPLSDKDRLAMAPELSPEPTNPLPFARGNSSQPVEPTDMLSSDQPSDTPRELSEENIEERESLFSSSPNALLAPSERRRQSQTGRRPLGEALENLDRYVEEEAFNNPRGGAPFSPGATLQFDTMGVEFGPWVRRFVAQVKRNWFVPQAAWLLRGWVVLQFNIHKDGRISDLSIVRPSEVVAFNNAAANAIRTSNPTEPLPPEYPAPEAFFTVTFYYNESPPLY